MSWELMINENSEIKGEIFFPEISNDVIDDDEDWEARVSITIGSDKVTKFINELIKKQAPENLRKAIKKNFVEELKKK